MWELFDYVDLRSRNDILAWMETLQKKDRARLEQKLDALQEKGPNLPANLLSDTPNPYIKKIRVNGDVALRPLLCVGPIDNDSEYTLLKGATERDRKFVPANAVEIAFKRRAEVIAKPTARRCPHGQEP